MIAVAVTAGLASVVAIVIGRGLLRESAVYENASNLRIYADAVRLYLDSARSLLETAAGSPGLTELISARARDRSRRWLPAGRAATAREIAARRLRLSKVFEYVMLLRPDGSVYLMEPYELEGKLSRRDLGYTAWYRKLMSTRQTVVSDLHISPATQRPTVVIATPVLGTDGQVAGIWAGGLRLEQLSLVGQEIGSRTVRGRYGYITDGRGLIIAHQAQPRYVVEQTDFAMVPPVRAALAGQAGEMQFISPTDGVEKLGAYMPLPGTTWSLTYVIPTRVAYAPLSRLVRSILVASGGIVVILGFVGFGLVRRIVGPLGQLTAAAQAFGSGEMTRRIEVRTGDEIERLADEFNHMAESLRVKEEQLRQRADQLEAANKELDAFTYSVSHDLRAPLRAMDGFSRILLDEYGPQLDREARRYLGIVRDSTRQMGHLVDDLLALSRLGRQALSIQSVDPTNLVRQALEELCSEQAGRRVESMLGDLPVCEADPALLKQVFLNLLSNALKFTRKRDPAVIEIGALGTADGRRQQAECSRPVTEMTSDSAHSAVRDSKSEIVYYVRDNGVGFDMRYAHKLFGVFQRLHRAEEYEGTGVGLAIVQRIILRHGGRVWAEAELDKGATFYFTLGN